MQLLEKTILEKGKVLPGHVLKVGSFLNQKIDVKLMGAMADEIYGHFKNFGVTKVLTVEASGIALATLVADRFGSDMVFAKKTQTSNVEGEVYSAECYSYTHKKTNNLIVPKDYIGEGDVVLIVDDFLANGAAVNALTEIVKSAKAEISGVAIVVEKGFQQGGDKLREKGYDVFSLAIIDEMTDSGIVFRKG